ncbi:MAG TPA: Holliday junction branch migration protein RuvA [Candidatus Paceibacterota bacterium]|nr:Holliday junction branch migration protein RuvA [Candidatus Paceibacterota bacterium]HPT40342.1 Holliday junction branch migration protein RuvA [Candidatus Paceibacterota bacterium]
MFYSIEGILAKKSDKFIVIENHGLGFRIFVSQETGAKLPKLGDITKLFLHHHVREDAMDLYGFLHKDEMELFELLISVSGIGPKTALGLIGLSSVENLKAAIISGKADFLHRAPGIGQKTAERIILELKTKIVEEGGDNSKLESDMELEDALVGLGYDKSVSRQAIKKIPGEIVDPEKRLKEALKLLSKKI